VLCYVTSLCAVQNPFTRRRLPALDVPAQAVVVSPRRGVEMHQETVDVTLE
jgi:hypothetical protein